MTDIVVENNKQGIARSIEATQMVDIQIRATVFDILGSRGLTIAMYL